MNYEGRKQVMLRIRRQYFDAIVSGEKKEELRKDSSKWSWLLGPNPPDVARFVCGQDTHLRQIESIHWGDAEEILGRPPSAQGRKDLGLDLIESTGKVIVIRLGFTMGICPRCGGLMWRGFRDQDGTPNDELDLYGCDKCELTSRIFHVVSRGKNKTKFSVVRAEGGVPIK